MIFAIIDTETGGFDPRRHELLEAHCLLADRETWRVLAEAGGRTLPRGDLEITPGAAKVNGYDAEVWKTTARPTQVVVPEVIMLATRADAWVGSNPRFDVKFLQAAAARQGWTFTTKAVYDVAILGRKAGDGKRVGLDKLCERYGIGRRTDAHGARDDCYRTLAVLQRIWEESTW